MAELVEELGSYLQFSIYPHPNDLTKVLIRVKLKAQGKTKRQQTKRPISIINHK